MHKHRGFPSRLPGSDFQFTIRRPNKKGPTPIIRRERFADRRNVDRKADEVFMLSLIESFGEEPFVRGNLDAGRLSWLFGREVLPVDDPFDPLLLSTTFSGLPATALSAVRNMLPVTGSPTIPAKSKLKGGSPSLPRAV